MEQNSAPFEILAGPLTLWLAPVGTVFPAIDEDPAVAWVQVGASGNRNYSEDGVTVTHDQTIEGFRSAGSTGKRKVFRTEEDQRITVQIADMTLAAYKVALNGNTVTDTVGDPKKIGLSRGREVTEYALLARGKSPYGDEMNMQYEVPRVAEVGSQEVGFVKGEPAMLELEFETLEDDNAATEDERFGRLVAQDSVSET